MSAIIPKTKTLSDLLKPTGFDCPETLRGKTFEEATSGGGSAGGIPAYDEIKTLQFGSSSGEIVASDVIDPSSHKTYRILTDVKNQELARYVEGVLDTAHSTLQPGKSVTVTNDSNGGGLVSLEDSLVPDQVNKGSFASGTIYNMGDFYLFLSNTLKISDDLDTWTDLTSKLSSPVTDLLTNGYYQLVVGTGFFYIWNSRPDLGAMGPTIYKVSVNKAGDITESNFEPDTEAAEACALADTPQNGYLLIGYMTSSGLHLTSIPINDSSAERFEVLLTDTDIDASRMRMLYVNNSWLLYNEASGENVYKFTGTPGSLVSAGTLTKPADNAPVNALYYLNNKLFYISSQLDTGFYVSDDGGTTWTTITVENHFGVGSAIYYLPSLGLYLVYNNMYGGRFSLDLTAWGDANLSTYMNIPLAPTLEGDGLVGIFDYREQQLYVTTFEAGKYVKVVTKTTASEMPTLIFLGEEKE